MPFTIIYPFDVTIPADTVKTAPLVTLTQFEANVVERIEWLFPEGCQGQVGIQIGARNVPVIPWQGATWFIRSGDSQGFDLDGMHTTGDWSVIGYNLGAFPHTIHVQFVVHRIVPPPKPLLLVMGLDSVGRLGAS